MYIFIVTCPCHFLNVAFKCYKMLNLLLAAFGRKKLLLVMQVFTDWPNAYETKSRVTPHTRKTLMYSVMSSDCNVLLMAVNCVYILSPLSRNPQQLRSLVFNICNCCE